MFEGHTPRLTEETVENNVDARMSRQKLLAKTPLVEFSFVIGEEALRNPVGGRETIREQLQHLLAQGKLGHVEIQVMPAQYGYHPGLERPMVLVETSEHRQFGYFESQGIGTVVSNPAQVSMFGLRYGNLRSQALHVEESARFIEHLAGSYEH